MLDVPDYSEVPIAQREGIARLVRWLSAHESEITFVERATWLSRYGSVWFGPWLLLASFACAAMSAWHDRRSIALRDATKIASLFAVALALRLLLGVWGPLRINGFGPPWISGAALDRSVLSAYGPGYAEVFGGVTALAPHAADTVIFGANAVLSALTTTLVYALARSFGVVRRAALLGAAVLAVDPVSIRMAATESYFVIITALTLAASYAFATSARRFGGGARRSSASWAIGGALLCAQAARVHPCAWIPVALAPFGAMGADAPGLRLRGRILAFALATALVGAVVVLTSGKVVALVLGEAVAWLPRSHAREIGLGVLAALAFVALARPRWVALPGAVWVMGMLATRGAYGQSRDWQSSYDHLFLPVLLIAVVACIPERFLRARLGAASGSVALLAMLAYAVVDLRRRTTDQLEYAWLRPYLDELPADCRVSWVDRAGLRVLALADYRPRRAPGGPRPMRPVYSDTDLPKGCVWYYRSSLCSSVEGRPVCDAIERRLQLAPIASATFPAVPSNLGLPYDRASVDVVLSRVEAR